MALTASEMQVSPGILRVPAWDRYEWLRAGFSTREGGRSQAYGEGEQNLGWTAEDDPAIVATNRQAFASAVTGGLDLPLVTVRQVHGATVRNLEQEPAPWMTVEGKAGLEGDGLVSLTPDRLLAILTADCVPVLLADTRTHAVGAFHAGWRGTLARIVETGVKAMHDLYGSQPQNLEAAIGPCIQACCFEVGDEVRQAFEGEFPYAADLFSPGKNGANAHMDLVQTNRKQLLHAGLLTDRIHAVGGCTSCSSRVGGKRQFFSYRAEGGKTGRMLSAIAAIA